METTIGLQSGRLEEEKFGFEKGSKIWDGKKWVSKEEWGKDRRINQKTGNFYRGSQTLHNIGNKLVETKDKISSTLTGIGEKVNDALPEVVSDSLTSFSEAAEEVAVDAAGTMLNKVTEPYMALSPEIRNAIQTSAAFVGQKAEDATIGLSQQFDVDPIITEGALAGLEFVATGGMRKPLQQALKYSDEMISAINIAKKLKLSYATSSVDDLTRSAIKSFNKPTDNTFFASTATRLGHSQRVTDDAILSDKTKWNETLTDYSKKRNVKTTTIAGESVEQARTATHHMKGLADSSNPIAKHPKGNQILSEARSEGLILGEHPGNYIAAMDTITQGSRRFKVKTIKDLYPGIPEKSIKDSLRQSIFDKSKWGLNNKELQALEEWQAFKLNAPPGSVVDTPKNVKNILNKTGDFPTIELINPNGSKTKWTPKTFKEYFNRWDKIGDHYGIKIDSKKIKGIKIDPNIDIYGKDHQHIHDMLKKLPSNIELEDLMASGKWQKLPVADAKKIYVNAMQDQYKVAVNMSEYRYNKISEYFTKFDPGSRDFTKLPVKEQVKYFQDNIEKLSSRGSFKELPDIEYLTKDVNITPGMKAIFGLK